MNPNTTKIPKITPKRVVNNLTNNWFDLDLDPLELVKGNENMQLAVLGSIGPLSLTNAAAYNTVK
jgi:hypothetical protein